VIALFLLAGAGVSVFRASVMTLFALTGILFRYRSDSTTALCFSAALLVLSNLYALESPSFLLSYASTLGLTTCGIPLSEYVRQRFTKKEMPWILKHLQALTLSLVMATVSFVFTTPVQLMLFDTASPFAPLYSVLLVPLFQICLILTLLGALSIPFLPDFVSSLLLRAAAAFPDLVEFLSKGAPAPVKIDDFSVMVACSFIAFLCVAFWKKAPCTAVFLLHGISFVFFGLISLIHGIFD
jgi:ComEC/Rec2-related protein